MKSPFVGIHQVFISRNPIPISGRYISRNYLSSNMFDFLDFTTLHSLWNRQFNWILVRNLSWGVFYQNRIILSCRWTQQRSFHPEPKAYPDCADATSYLLKFVLLFCMPFSDSCLHRWSITQGENVPTQPTQECDSARLTYIDADHALLKDNTSTTSGTNFLPTTTLTISGKSDSCPKRDYIMYPANALVYESNLMRIYETRWLYKPSHLCGFI